MLVAITADVHLTARAAHPERLAGLEAVLAATHEAGATTLIVAGDLFDASLQNYELFEQICRAPAHRDIQFLLLPGNHDPDLRDTSFAAENVRVIAAPALLSLGENTLPFLFVPYARQATMGAVIAAFAAQLPPGAWVLVGHGDYAEGLRAGNPYEPGVYMPLTRADLTRYQPARAFLGHIHVPLDRPPVHYAGSPCGLDITETGRRRLLLYDAAEDRVTAQPLAAPRLFFDETLVVLPVADEAQFVREQVAARLARWQLSAEERARTQIRLRVSGYSANKGALLPVLHQCFAGFSFYKGQGPDLSQVYLSDDVERNAIAEAVRARVGALDWAGRDEPDAEAILLQALHTIYGTGA
jgi:DNA repair exonuclease SbcCD nuclease subunit